MGMPTAKEIWDAGKKALGLPVTVTASVASAPAPAAPAPAQDAPAVFDATQFAFEDRDYRVTFKNGCSAECGGMALKHNFCFDPAQIERIEPVEEVGLGL